LAEAICDTSPLQSLHQIEHLDVLPSRATRVLVPPAVLDELQEGRRLGLDLPDVNTLDWVEVLRLAGASALPLVMDLGPGESEALALAVSGMRPTVRRALYLA
jgi:predicted nucleic acid-binding protein